MQSGPSYEGATGLGLEDAKQTADAAVRLDLGLLIGGERAFARLKDRKKSSIPQGITEGKLKAEGRQGWDPKKFVRPPAYHQIRPSLHLREKLGLSEGVYRPALGTALRRMLINQQKMDSFGA